MDATDNCFVYYVLCIVHCAHTALFVVLEYSLALSFSESLRYLRVIPYTASFNDPPPPFIVLCTFHGVSDWLFNCISYDKSQP